MSTGTDPETALDHPAARSRQKSMSVSEWYAQEGLIPALTPMAYREGDPIDQLRTVREGIDALPHTAATFTASSLLGDNERFTRTFAASEHLTTLFRLCGAFRIDETSTGYRWCNPDYVHGSPHREPVGTTAERVWFAKQAASLGVLSTVDVARKYGVAPRVIQKQCSNHDVDWVARRHAGKGRLARTVATVSAWTDYTYTDVGDLVNVSESALFDWRDRHVADEWSPPADPTTEYGFTGR